MIEQAEEEEKLRRQDELDAANDVTKQKDLSKFYRNLLDGNVSMGAPVEEQEHSRVIETKTAEKNKESGEEKVEKYSTPESENEEVNKFSRDKSSNKKGKQYHSLERSPSEKARGKRSTYRSSDGSCEEATGDRQPVVSGKANERRRGERRYRKGRARDERTSSSESDSDHVEKSRRESGTKRNSNDDKYSSKSKSPNHRYSREGSGSKDSTGRLDRDARIQSHSKHGREGSQAHDEKYQKEKRSRERSRESKRERSSEKGKRERSGEGNKRRHASSGSSPEISRKKDKGGRSVERKNQSDRQYLEQKTESKNNGKETINKERSKVFAKRNDADSVLGARERYLARKQGRIVPITHDDDSD
eukprot:gene15226-6430_t